MQRIVGQDPNGVWHIASSTYTTTMHTKCGRWLRAIAFAVEGAADQWPPAVPVTDKRCSLCLRTAMAQLAGTH